MSLMRKYARPVVRVTEVIPETWAVIGLLRIFKQEEEAEL